MTTGRQITSAQDALTFMLAGNATITIKSLRTGEHLTFKVRAPRETRANGPSHFVSVRTHGDEGNWPYLGCIYASRNYAHGRKSVFDASSPQAMGFQWAMAALMHGKFPRNCEIWHEGTCGRCGRQLTVPESIASGLGPECAGKVQKRNFICEEAA